MRKSKPIWPPLILSGLFADNKHVILLVGSVKVSQDSIITPLLQSGHVIDLVIWLKHVWEKSVWVLECVGGRKRNSNSPQWEPSPSTIYCTGPGAITWSKLFYWLIHALLMVRNTINTSFICFKWTVPKPDHTLTTPRVSSVFIEQESCSVCSGKWK